MALSRGVEYTVSAASGNLGLSSMLSAASAVAGQLAVVSVESNTAGGALTWPAGWTVWQNAEVGGGGLSAWGSVATKVLLAGDISGSETVTFTSTAYPWNASLVTYAGDAPTVDTASAAFG